MKRCPSARRCPEGVSSRPVWVPRRPVWVSNRPVWMPNRPEAAVLFSTLQVLTGAAAWRPCRQKIKNQKIKSRIQPLKAKRTSPPLAGEKANSTLAPSHVAARGAPP